MPINDQTLNNEMYEILRSRRYDPVPLGANGDPTDDVGEADVMSFTMPGDTPEGKVKVWITIEGDYIVLYIDNKVTESPDWETFEHFMKRWSKGRTMKFKITNRDRLIGDMKKRAIMNKKEQVLEGYHAMGKKASYNDAIPQVKIILQHTRQIEEGEQRFRNIAKIFVENVEGERFLLPTTRPGLARVYGRHIAEGGTPYDEKGHHITSLVEEYQKMAGFVRATRSGQFNESAMALVNEGLKHYNDLRMTLQGMASHRGYNNYFENYTPVLNEEVDEDISLNELFVEETLDPRIESVMPILKRLSKNITEMSEVKELDEWAKSITEMEDEEVTEDRPSSKETERTWTDKSGHKHTGRQVQGWQSRAADKAANKERKQNDKELEENFGKDLTRTANMEKAQFQSDMEEGVLDKVKSGVKKVFNKVAPDDETLMKDLAQKAGIKSKELQKDHPGDPNNFVKGGKQLGIFKEEGVAEDLDANQKRVGQLGPVGGPAKVGDLVGTNESKDTEEKDKEGKVKSWKHEGDWEKADNKNPVGKIHHMSDVARRETEKKKENTSEGLEDLLRLSGI